jgi:predicted peptidase
MRTTTFQKLGLAGLALCLALGSQLASAQQLSPQNGQAAAPSRGGRGQQPPDPRVQNRTYLFTETNEQIPYAVFVSSTVSKDKKNPLIVALHGLGGNPHSLLRGNALDLAEAGGYIMVGAMGYNPGGWYGIPAAPGGRGFGSFAGVSGGGSAVTDDAKVRELSEKDVLNVLELMRKEFNIDERRTYLMGHSMGGGGTLYLGVKHSQHWAALASIAPAGGGNPDRLESIKSMPVIIIQGDMDTAVPATSTRRYAEKLKALSMTHEYHEIPGGDHGNVIGIGMPDILRFFGQHSKP